MRRLLLGLICATLLLPACGDDDDGDRAAVTSIPERTTSSTSSTTTTEPRVPPPDVIPADIDLITEEYVEQVLNALYEVSLEAILLIRDAGLVDERVLAIVDATYSDATSDQQANDLLDLSYEGLEVLRNDPGPLNAQVVRLTEVTSTCIAAEIRVDSSNLVETVDMRPTEQRDFVRLRAASDEQLRAGHNPTAWVFDGAPVTLDGSVPDLPCA